MKRPFKLIIFIILSFFILRTTSVYAEFPTLFFSTPIKQVAEGEKLDLDVKVNSPLQSVNAVSGIITFPESLIRVVSISKDKSVINLWTQEPRVQRNKILFEGIILNPGFKGSGGVLFNIIFEAKKTGTVLLDFSEGSILANDGLGTNILSTLGSANFKIVPSTIVSVGAINNVSSTSPTAPQILPPVITSLSLPVDGSQSFSITGKGEPNALTEIQFQDITEPSLGRSFFQVIMKGKIKLSNAELINDKNGIFSYISPADLVAGTYNALPLYIDSDHKVGAVGYGVNVTIVADTISEVLNFIVNTTIISVPIILSITLLFFLPWYFIKRLKMANQQIELKEEEGFYKRIRYKTVKLFALIVGAEASLVVIGWITGTAWMTRIWPYGINMKFPTALMFFFSAWGLYFICRSMRKDDERARTILVMISFLIFLSMSSFLWGGISGTQTGIENLFVQQQSPSSAFGAGWPSLPSVIGFILFGITGIFSFFTDSGRHFRLKFFGCIITTIGLIPVIGYILHLPVLYYQLSSNVVPMALNTALSFVLLGCGLIIVGQTKNKKLN